MPRPKYKLLEDQFHSYTYRVYGKRYQRNVEYRRLFKGKDFFLLY